AAALAATLFGGPLAAILRAISSACKTVANVLGTIADFLQNLIDPIKKIVDKLNGIKKQIEKVAEIAKIIKEALDVYKWLTAKTADERADAAKNILANVDLVKGFVGKFIGGRFAGFAEKFWSKAAPIVQPLQNV